MYNIYLIDTIINLNLFISGHFIFGHIILEIIKVIGILLSIAFLTLSERKVMGSVQRRFGPNTVGIFGLLQPIADGLKLIVKEMLLPNKIAKPIFILAPFFFFLLSTITWTIIPGNIKYKLINRYITRPFRTFSEWTDFLNIEFGILLIFIISGLSVYALIFGGWSSNSKYAFLGGLRSSAQMISYEVSMGLTLMPTVMLSNAYNISAIRIWQKITGAYILPLFCTCIMFLIAMLAETNRAPFDLPEAEGELVAGYNVEYASIMFALFFLAEYNNIIIMAVLLQTFWFGGFLSLKMLNIIIWTLFTILVILIRASYPRYRYDQLMEIGWKVLLPISLSGFMFISSLIQTCHIYFL